MHLIDAGKIQSANPCISPEFRLTLPAVSGCVRLHASTDVCDLRNFD